ncbi:response regulator transcription factor [Motiliproteus sp. MSK22-1]|uniref:response regulator transcription factor n=1 Tax=Motiliproteus sp. MSK22-1 TaxID=1897630 RepID=UPI0009789C47|nr:response regulator transcription factor [Motiliproteus sp. MSK22-1]OMH29128.1 hypothetical protein BGP75_20465 [Motiliproteus sp. MSK22-1]
MRLLLIDDDIELGELVQDFMKRFGQQMDIAQTPSEGFEALKNNTYDIILLDIMLPEMNGFELCRQLRKNESPARETPIIMLTARSEMVNLVAGLEAGADDYVIKPFEPRELLARANAIQRRTPKIGKELPVLKRNTQLIQLDDNTLEIDTSEAKVMINDTDISLTPMELEILATLASAPGEIMSREDINEACQQSISTQSKSIDALIYRIRLKIRETAEVSDFISTVRNQGYVLRGRALD